jgi:hypothetical protein
MNVWDNFIGQKFGRLTVVEKAGRDKKRNALWLCRCDCGGEKIVRGYDLKNGKTQSCGCLRYEELKGRAEDLSGQRFSRLLVLERSEDKKRTAWLCKCDCGNEVIVTSLNLKNGSSNSCGCYQKEKAAAVNFKHGLSSHPLFDVHYDMLRRCYNSSCKSYKNYGARGINVCDEWRDDVNSFIQWGEKDYKPGLQIDRIDNDGNYEPENCRWVSNKENSNNKRTNKYITFKGKIQTQAQWARELDINEETFAGRLRAGWSEEKAITTPVNHNLAPRSKLRSINNGS